MRRKPAYYLTYGLKDGTITAVLQTRKPLKKSLRRGEKIDEDGVYRTYVHECSDYQDLEDRHYVTRHVALAGRLNTRRAIRELVLPRLDEIASQLEAINQRLDKLESEKSESS